MGIRKSFFIMLTLFLLYLPLAAIQAEDVDGVSTGDSGGWGLLEGIKLDDITEIPSGWSMFWRGVKETIITSFTFDAEKKAELQLQFAEERLRIAELMGESDNPKTQRKAQKVMNKADKLIQRLEKKKDKWFEGAEGNQRLLKNWATHQLNREKVMDVLEENLPEDALDELQDLRDDALNQKDRLINAISNENVPEQVREHLQNVKDRIEEHAADIKEFQAEKKELLDQVKEDGEDVKDALKALRAERKQKLQQRIRDFQDKSRGNKPNQDPNNDATNDDDNDGEDDTNEDNGEE